MAIIILRQVTVINLVAIPMIERKRHQILTIDTMLLKRPIISCADLVMVLICTLGDTVIILGVMLVISRSLARIKKKYIQNVRPLAT